MKKNAVIAIRAYQLCLSPFWGNCCRFYPSCSEYTAEAIEKHGLRKGFILGVIRISKCGPWHPGGVDEVPTVESTTSSQAESDLIQDN